MGMLTEACAWKSHSGGMGSRHACGALRCRPRRRAGGGAGRRFCDACAHARCLRFEPKKNAGARRAPARFEVVVTCAIRSRTTRGACGHRTPEPTGGVLPGVGPGTPGGPTGATAPAIRGPSDLPLERCRDPHQLAPALLDLVREAVVGRVVLLDLGAGLDQVVLLTVEVAHVPRHEVAARHLL